MTDPLVADLLRDCPFLRDHLNERDFDLPTVVFGGAATLVMAGHLPPDQVDALFNYVNRMAESRDADEVLGTGFIEMFNDNAAVQTLARARLTGRAREMLEEFRRFWGQPDYEAGTSTL